MWSLVGFGRGWHLVEVQFAGVATVSFKSRLGEGEGAAGAGLACRLEMGRWAEFFLGQIAMLSFKSMPGTKTAQESDPKVRVSLPHTLVFQQEHSVTHTEPHTPLEHTQPQKRESRRWCVLSVMLGYFPLTPVQ